MLDKFPDFNVKVYKGDNSISLTKTDSGILSTIQNSNRINNSLAIFNTKQLISYHMIRIISDNYKYMDKDIYGIVNSYIYNLSLSDFLKDESGREALKLNIMAEFYKIGELLPYCGKPLVTDMTSIGEEVDALVNKIFNTIK